MKQLKRKLYCVCVVCVYFGTNGYFHFLHFSHTSKRKCVYVCAAQIDNKMYKFKTEKNVRVFFFFFCVWGSNQ